MRKLLVGLGLGLGAAAIVLLLGLTGLFETVELKLYDWRMRLAADTRNPNPDIVLVEINDASIRDLSPVAGRWPWPRLIQSNLIDFLSQARVVAYDVTLSERTQGTFQYADRAWTGDESDQEMVKSVAAAGNVIMLADAVFAGADEGQLQSVKPAEWRAPAYRLGPAIEERPLILPPFQALTDAAAGLGHNFLPLDPDGPARRMPPFIRSGERYLPSLGIAAALKWGGFRPDEIVLDGETIRVRDRRIPLVPVRVESAATGQPAHDQQTMLINYRAPVLVNHTRPFRTYEARHLLISQDQISAGQPPLVDPAVFKDKLVFVGMTTSGLVDVFQTPFGSELMPGIQLHASMADSLLSNRFLRPAPDSARLAATLAGAVIVGLMSTMLPFVAGSIGAAGCAVAWSAISVLAFRRGLWLNMLQPLTAMAVALFAGTAYRYFVEDYQKRVVKKLFGRYVSKDVYNQLIEHPDRAELGGKRREMSVLFSDIRGFTTVTEKGNPEELVAQLNEYFSRMVEIVFLHKGTVDKFVGDMVMALYGAPLDDVDHAEHAVQTAIEMVKELGALNRGWAARGMAELDIGVGVNSGEMIAGNIGSSSIMSYTVIGDNVNLGSRLESLNKDYKTRIIISDATRIRLKGEYDVGPLGDVVVKGKTRPIAIYEIRVPAPIQEVKQVI
ncbi:MAG: adenylate/guanylate cyclase domain-containing protein [Acidobacteriota bacterium]